MSISLSPESGAEFRAIARGIPALNFSCGLSDAEKQLVARLHDGTLPRRNLYKLNASWAIKLYLAREQRIIAVYPDAQFSEAARFADMAIWYFWDYRRKHATLPSEDQLNLSVARAKADRENENELLQPLIRMRGLLPDSSTLLRRSTAGPRISVSSTVDRRLSTIIDGLAAIRARLDQIELRIK